MTIAAWNFIIATILAMIIVGEVYCLAEMLRMVTGKDDYE